MPQKESNSSEQNLTNQSATIDKYAEREHIKIEDDKTVENSLVLEQPETSEQAKNKDNVDSNPKIQLSWYLKIKNNEILCSQDLINDFEKIFKKEIVDLKYLTLMVCYILENGRDELKKMIENFKAKEEVRKIWYLCEEYFDFKFDTEDLPIDDKPVISVLNSKYQFTLDKKYYSRRHHVIDNILGNKYFSVTIALTEKLKKLLEYSIKNEINKTIYNFENYRDRANSFIYKNDVKYSFSIEKETYIESKNTYFNKLACLNSFIFSKNELIKLQNNLVSDNFKNQDWRAEQIYVGRTFQNFKYKQSESYDYVCPQPGDLESLMNGLIVLVNDLINRNSLNEIVTATIVSFSFVYLHPFDDGNGRLSRFLIHWVLFKRLNVIFPISESILNRMKDYDCALEHFSNSIMNYIDFSMINNSITVNNQTKDLYQNIDLTKQTEYLFDLISVSLTEFKKEILFLYLFDNLKNFINLNNINLEDKWLKLIINAETFGKSKIKKSRLDSQAYDKILKEKERLICTFNT